MMSRDDGTRWFGGLVPELAVAELLGAYAQGCFPMDIKNHRGEAQLVWFSPDPRTIIDTAKFHLSRSMRRVLARGDFTITYNHQFGDVIRGCAERPDTWITPRLMAAYTQLHEHGYAHSVEVICEGELAGGVYGVKLGGAYFAESMFHRRSNMSKVALWALNEQLKAEGHTFFDCQFMNEHLRSLGAEEIPRGEFLQRLRQALVS